MDKAKLIERLMATFLEELDEHVRSLNQDLLALEKTPDAPDRAERLKTLFRTAHSLKGAARSVNVGPIESVCHRLEDILAAVREGRSAFTPDLFALLFATADSIEEAGMRLREQKDLADSPLAALLPQLAARAEGCAPPTSPKGMGPAPRAPKEKITSTVTPPYPLVPSPSQPLPPSPSRPASAATVEPPPDVPTGGSSVRVPAEKLDTLLAQIGELLVVRRRVEGRLGEIQLVQDFVEQWTSSWRPVEKMLGKVLARSERGRADDVPSRETAGPFHSLPRRVGLVLRQSGDNLRRLEKDLDRLGADMARDARFLKQVAVPLDGEVRRVRMLPFADACQGLDRTIRDLALAAGKDVELMVEGGAVELDRSVLEGLKDPLRHLVRNAVDHGIETPDRRRAAGKAPQGRIAIAAALRGAQVEVVVRDDGRGLDMEGLREQARRRRLPEPTDDRELAYLVFLPGLSTAPIITDVSGRGVGLDVVKTQVEALHGTVDLTTVMGQGTRFTLNVPLTLTTLRVVLAGVAGQTFAISSTNIHKLARVSAEDFRTIGGRQMLLFGGSPLPLAHLGGVLGLGVTPGKPGEKQPVLIVAAGEKRMAFLVDEFLAEQEIVVKSLGARIRRLRLVSGGTLLPSGGIALVLNAAGLVRAALRHAPASISPLATGKEALPAKKRLLVVDDSVTTRTLEKSILEAAGYDVTAAADGQAAWQVLHEGGFDLLVSDVEMPRMDGFALTEAVRSSKRFQGLPVVLVTALESERDKARGIEAGADAYLVKSAFDQKNLLETIAQLL